MASIEEKDRVLPGQILRNMKRLALDGLNGILGEKVSNVKLPCHDSSSLFKCSTRNMSGLGLKDMKIES